MSANRPSPLRTDKEERDPAILVVDDDPFLLGLLVRWLRDESLHVLTATNGLQALNLLAQHSFRLVVADYRLPGMDGLRLLNTVQSRWPDCARILLTGYADSTLLLEARAHKVLSKEMDPGLIKRAILRAANR